MFKLAIDTGGTFTDLGLWDATTHEAVHHKVPAIPSAPWESVIQGVTETLALARATPDQIGYFTHGTTIGVNAILQRKRAKAALVTTKGFKDILEIGRMELVNQFDLMTDKPLPLIDRKDVFEANERIRSSGEVEGIFHRRWCYKRRRNEPYARLRSLCTTFNHKPTFGARTSAV